MEEYAIYILLAGTSVMVFGYIGLFIDGAKGVAWGMILGPFGLIIAATLKKKS
jgi:hypothetical protein